MSIFFVKTVPFSTKVESFDQRGLSNCASAKCKEAGVFVVEKNSFPLTLKYTNIQYELLAISEKKTMWVTTDSSRTGDFLKRFKYFPFEGPVLCVEMKNEGGILNSLGLYEAGTGKMGLYAGTPNMESMASLMNLGLDMYTTVPAGNVNIAGYMAWVYAWRGINAYFAVGGGKNREYAGQMWIGEGPASRIQGSPEKMETKNSAGVVTQKASKEVKPGGIVLMSEVALKSFGVDNGNAAAYIINADENITQPGFLFEYFRDMLEADPDGPFEDFFSLFRNCLATTMEESSELVTVLRRGFRYLCHSQPGKIVQHIYFCMKVAIKLGGDLRLIQDGGRYAGCVVFGPGEILVKNKVKTALSAEELGKHVSSLNRHRAAVENLCNILDILERTDGKAQEIDRVKARSNPRVIREAIMNRGAVAIEEVKTELNQAIGDLRYAQDYWPITPENILRFFLAMAGRHNFENEPMYVSVESLTNRSSEVLPYLAVFGARAPVIHYGNKVVHVTSLDKEDPNLEKKNGKTVLPYIPFEIMGLSAAAGSWATAKKAHAIKFKLSGNVRDGALCANKDRAGILGSVQFEPMYSALRQWMYSEHEVRKDKGKKPVNKRTADEMDDAEASQSKKTKVTLSFF